MTIQSALRVLRRSGLIVSWQGRGSYARTTHSTPPVTSDPGVSYDDLVCRIDTLTEMMNRLGDRLARVEKQLASSS